jgi:PAS domain S-box-containing protein
MLAIEDSAAPIRNARGEISGAVMVFHDVTARRRAEAALAASEQQFRAIFNQAAIGICVSDLDGRVLDANEQFARILGRPADTLRGLTLDDFTHPDDISTTQARMQQLRSGELPHFAEETRYLRKDGETVWTRTTVALLRNEHNEPDRTLTIVEDVTEQRHAAQALREAEEVRSRLAAVVECSDDAIISKDLNGIVVTWNNGAERVFGYTAEEMIGKPILLLIPENHADEEPAILARLRRGERIDHYETCRRRKDGTLIDISLSVSPIRNAAGQVIGASKIARDITEQKRAEARLRELYESAQQEIRHRMRAEAALRETDRRKDEFLATLAHELRNPLAPIRQAAAISKAPTATDDQKRWSHDVISRQVNHMALLLDDLLDISRVTRGILELRPEMTDLAHVVDTAVETASPVIDAKRHTLSVEMPQEPVRFAADPLRLAQVLSNLLTNAAKYTDSEGNIRLSASATADTITISVADTGIGIPPDALEEVFAMFSQVKSAQDRSEGGLGIGLALAKGLVQLHRGTIEARSAGLGLGSEFIVHLPRRTLGDSTTETSSPAPTTEPVGRRVLIADDNRDAADSLAMLLRMDGHDVTVVHDGRQALATIHTVQPEVAVLDIGMPMLNGYEVARQVRQLPKGKEMTLIAVTGWGQASDKADAAAAGFDHHFTKPIEPEKLSQLLRAARA